MLAALWRTVSWPDLPIIGITWLKKHPIGHQRKGHVLQQRLICFPRLHRNRRLPPRKITLPVKTKTPTSNSQQGF